LRTEKRKEYAFRQVCPPQIPNQEVRLGASTNYQSGTCGNSHCPNNSGSQGALYHQQFSSTIHPQPHYAFTGINACNGEEGVTGSQATTPNGTSAVSAIESDMANHCTK